MQNTTKYDKNFFQIQTSYCHCCFFLSVLCSEPIRNNKKKHKAVIKKHLLNSYSLTSYGTHFLVKTCISKLYSSNPEMNTFRQV